jgi:hypothetical protein
MATLSIPVSADGELKVKPEYLSAKVSSEEVESVNGPADGVEKDEKRQKQRGRNKDR